MTAASAQFAMFADANYDPYDGRSFTLVGVRHCSDHNEFNRYMLMTIALLIVSGGLASFMVNRIYVMAVYKAINVKGQHYDKAADPFQFWFSVGAACFGLLFGLGLFILSSAALLGII